ncbi:MAG: hypothetical protein DI603_15190 [Roseateles depolymerans]|uniref:Uncharacterized protein n=1 Tax=Roseateles depolymerans TaxID=76731 RepID=A0A2W5FCM1_9BURK|nr:MAG: hypothetical protein DI603_15190 [Roseateles depolymerans]
MEAHPPAQRGVLAPHLGALKQLAQRGYTHQEMRAWLASQGVTVSRQAVTKALATHPATDRQPLGNQPATAKQGEATKKRCSTTPTNRGAAPPPGPDATLKERAQAVGDQYLTKTLNPLAAQLLAKTTTNRKA